MDVVPAFSTPEDDNPVFTDWDKGTGTFHIKVGAISGRDLRDCITQAVLVGSEKIVIQARVRGSCVRLFEALMHNKNVSLDVSEMDTSGVTDMSLMFYGCEGLTSLDLSGWDTSNVTDMSYMFEGCEGLTSLDLSDWDMSNVTDMSYMFKNCHDLERLNLSGWQINKEANINRLFDDCEKLLEIVTEDKRILNLDPPTDEYRFQWRRGVAYGTKYFFSSDEEAEALAAGMAESFDEYYIVKVAVPPFYSKLKNMEV